MELQRKKDVLAKELEEIESQLLNQVQKQKIGTTSKAYRREGTGVHNS